MVREVWEHSGSFRHSGQSILNVPALPHSAEVGAVFLFSVSYSNLHSLEYGGYLP